MEQLVAKKILQPADLMTEGRWRNAEFVGGPRETEVPGGGLERAERIERWQGAGHAGFGEP